MKYIDADKLIAEIERRKNQTERRLDNIVPIRRKDTMDEEQLAKIELRDKVDKAYLNAVLITLSDILSFITSLHQEQDLIIINKKDWEAQEQFRKNKKFGVPLQQERPQVADASKMEQPEVDLEEEMDKYYDSPLWDGENVSWMTYTRIARHFAEWGAIHLNTRKENTK